MNRIDNSEVPYVIVHASISVDGRMTTARGYHPRNERDGFNINLYVDLHRRLGCDAVMMGSNTATPLNELDAKSPTPIESLPELYRGIKCMSIIPDSRGRVNWSGWQKDPRLKGLVVLCSKITPPLYIKHLCEEQIPYVVAGEDHVDLRAALKEVKAQYGVKRIICVGGGAINGALLRAGLVNEVSVIIVPLAIGGIDTPTLFDASNLVSLDEIVRLQLINCEHVKENFTWLHYKVVRKG